jgi:4-hydroxybenzoate polyprenyltransferase
MKKLVDYLSKINNIKPYLNLVRLFTLLAPFIISFCIMLASFFYNDNKNVFSYLYTIFLPASFSLAFLNAASNALNQITDIRSDKISKPYRPLIQGNIKKKQALSLSIILYCLSLILSFFVNIAFFIIIILILFFTITYSIPPRIKDILFFNQIWIGISRGFLGIIASWSVFGNPLHPLPLTIGLIATFFLIGGSITKDLIDIEADKKTGTKTLVNTFGIKKAAIICFPFMFFPFAFIPILVDCGLLKSNFGVLTLLSICSVLITYLIICDNDKGKIFENTKSWVLMYFTYFILAFGFSLLIILENFKI